MIYPKLWQQKSLINWLLFPFSLIYWLISKVRQLVISPHILKAKVICVGNATIGGTGKTQIVIALSKILTEMSIKHIVLSKGYGGSINGCYIYNKGDRADPNIAGDEVVEILQYAPVIVSSCFKEAVPLIRDVNVVIMDDGMQNPYIHKNFTILVIDGDRKFGNEMIIPSGPLRESVKSAVKKSDIAIVVGVTSSMLSLSLETLQAKIKVTNSLDNTNKYYAFAGIGNNERFFALLRHNKILIQKTASFPDHYKYQDRDIKRLIQEANSLGLKLITTRKDYVKLQKYKHMILCCEVSLEIEQVEKLIKKLHEKVLS